MPDKKAAQHPVRPSRADYLKFANIILDERSGEISIQTDHKELEQKFQDAMFITPHEVDRLRREIEEMTTILKVRSGSYMEKINEAWREAKTMREERDLAYGSLEKTKLDKDGVIKSTQRVVDQEIEKRLFAEMGIKELNNWITGLFVLLIGETLGVLIMGLIIVL